MNEGKYVAMTRCFICGEDADFVINTRLKDISGLHGKTASNIFCSHCKEAMNNGVFLIETIGSDMNAERISENELYNVKRTGRFVCISKDFFIRNGLERYNQYPFIFVRKEEEIFEKLGVEFDEEKKP